MKIALDPIFEWWDDYKRNRKDEMHRKAVYWRRKFAFLPTRTQEKDGTQHLIWLRFYYTRREYYNGPNIQGWYKTIEKKEGYHPLRLT